MVLVVMLYKMVLTFESVDEILNFDLTNESYRGVLISVIFSLISRTDGALLGIVFFFKYNTKKLALIQYTNTFAKDLQQ